MVRLSLILLLVAAVYVSAVVPVCTVSIVGAGPGGLYTAWRLASSGKVKPSEICVFEQNDRVGGRVYTIAQHPEVSELSGFKLDLGAERFNPISEIFTAQLIEKLGLPILCAPYSDDCTPAKFLYLRGKYLSQDTQVNSTNWPYFVNPNEEWGVGKPYATRPSPEDLTFVLLPFLSSYIANLTSVNPAIKWKAVSDVLLRSKDYPIYGTTTPGDTNARVAFETLFSTELFESAIDANWGGSTWTYKLNFFWALREVVVQIAGLGYPYYTPVGGFGKWVQELASKFTGYGGKIFYNSEVVSLNKFLFTKSTVLSFKDGTSIISPTVVLNLPPHSIRQLGSRTPYGSPASDDALLAFNLPFNIHSAKIYVYYADAWWANQLGLISASVSTTEFVRNVFFDNTTIKYDPITRKYRGWIGTYAYGDDIAGYFRAASADQASVLSVVKNDASGGKLLFNIHTSLIRIFAAQFPPSINPLDLAPPTKGVLANWNTHNLGGFHAVQPSPLDPSYILQLFQTSVDNSVYVVNEAFSPRNGWAEGSLTMAEKFLKKKYNLDRPSWLDASFYKAIILQDV